MVDGLLFPKGGKKKKRRIRHPPSLMQEDRSCYLCRKYYGTHTHHIFGGPDRIHSEEYGLKVRLCVDCHNLAHTNKEIQDKLHHEGQIAFERMYGHDDFIKTFRKNYL